MVSNLGKKNKWEEDQAERSFVWVYLSIVASHVLQKVIQQVSLIVMETMFISVVSMVEETLITLVLKTEQAKVVLKSLDMMMKVG
jgi:hypothetical protein